MLAGSGATLLLANGPLRAAPGVGERRQDIEIVRRALALHPGLYRYQSPQDVEVRLRQLDRDYGRAESLDQQFLILSAFLARVRCGHTHCNPYNQKKAITAALFDRPTKLPFEFGWIDGRMVVLADRSGQGLLPRGSEILAIDGRPARDLLRQLVTYSRADGANDAKRVAQMAMLGSDRLETFDIFQGLIAPPRQGSFRIAYRTPAGKRGTAQMAALTSEQRNTTRHTVETDGTSEPFWTWEMRGGVAILTMPSWVMYNSKWKWEAWLDERLASLTGAKGLIIDLRENVGGNECGNAVFARLSAKDMQFEGYRQWVRYRRTPKDLDPYLDTWDDSFRTIGEKATDQGNGFFDLGVEGSDLIAAKGPRLELPVAALVGPVCSSATFSFARR